MTNVWKLTGVPSGGKMAVITAEGQAMAGLGKHNQAHVKPWTSLDVLWVRTGLPPLWGYLVTRGDFHIALGVFALAGLLNLLNEVFVQNLDNQKSTLGYVLG